MATHVRISTLQKYLNRLESRTNSYMTTANEFEKKGNNILAEHYQSKVEALREIIEEMKEEFLK